MHPSPAHSGVSSPRLTEHHVLLSLADPGHDLAAVRVYQELSRPRDGATASFADGHWTARVPRPDVPLPRALRLEYAFILTDPAGGEAFATDPANPGRADGPFGAKSVVELPGYREPTWVRAAPDPPSPTWTTVALPRFDPPLRVGIWQPAGHAAGEPLPLLVVHDGPEYASYAGLLRFLAAAVDAGAIPPLRAALLDPLEGLRNETYSATARWADALVFTVLPWLLRVAPVPGGHRPVLMGASLGGLAALHAAHRHPHRFGGLLLQSGSFFRARTDPQERGFAHFDRVSRFVGAVLRARRATNPLPVVLTCGLAEENLANNRVMADGLRRAGHDAVLIEHPDGHNFTSWRDVLDRALPRLLPGARGPGGQR